MRHLLIISASALAIAACAPEGEDASEETAENGAASEMADAAGETAGEAAEAVEDAAEEVEAMAEDAMDGETEEAAAPEWGYDGEIAAAEWGSLDEAWAACDAGTEQSPIDFTAPYEGDAPVPELAWTPSTGATVVDNGHTIQVNLEGAGGLTLAGTEYDLVQFHFHAGSEHTLDGEQYPFEVHFVHASDAGELAVVGVFFEDGEAEPALEPIWANLPDGEGEAALDAAVDANAFLPDETTAWRYAGSLTTPPCSEGVAWTVFADPITLSSDQLAGFTARYDGNYRPVQPLNDRTVAAEEVGEGE